MKKLYIRFEFSFRDKDGKWAKGVCEWLQADWKGGDEKECADFAHTEATNYLKTILAVDFNVYYVMASP
jgi:hypothetical protein